MSGAELINKITKDINKDNQLATDEMIVIYLQAMEDVNVDAST